MSELVAFLTARLDEDEAVARLADSVTDKREDDWQDVTQPLTLADTLGREPWAKKYGHAYEHIARHDPARVLAEVDAKRRIVAEHRRADWDVQGQATCETCVSPDDWTVTELPAHLIYPCRTLRLLALPFADHPDYDERWRP